jgi:hypothetical protein
LSGGITGALGPTAPAQRPAAVPRSAAGVAVDVALAQRAAQLAMQWRPDARLIEIVAQVGSDGSADVSNPPQAVSLWFVAASAPGESLMMSLAPDGSFVSAPATRMDAGMVAPPAFVSAGQAVGAAQASGLKADWFHAKLRPATGSGVALGSFAWVVTPAGGGREVFIDALTGKPLR